MAERALVVFSGQADLAWQRLLCPGFRHCSLILEEGSDWILVEPLATRMQVRRLGLASVDLRRRLTCAGLTVVETEPYPASNRAAPPGLWTCVETVKRGLGIRAVWVQTPWQLYRFLEQNRKIRIDSVVI